MAKETKPVFSQTFMETALRDAGLKAGDKVIIHSSLKDIASFRELVKLPNTGMDIILDALKNVITQDGIVCFPTFASTFVPVGPTNQPGKNYGAGPGGEVWDKTKTPSRVGSFTDYVWRQPGFYRSNHPTHSLAAWGKAAEAFVAGHDYDMDSTFGKKTPWGKMFKMDFKILFLGTWFNTCTAVHLSEDWLGLPYMAPHVQVVIKGKDGQPKEVSVTGSPWGSRSFYATKNNPLTCFLLERYRELFRIVTHGKCSLTTMSFRGLCTALNESHYDNPLLLLPDPKLNEFSAKWADATVQAMAKRKPGDWLEGLE